MLALGVGGVAGCAETRVLTDLPAPVFLTASRPHQAPAPPPIVQAEPVGRSLRGEPGWLPPGGISRRWSCVVIHHSAVEVGGAVAFDRYHRNVKKWDELGYHFVIGNGSDTADGEIEVGTRWTKQKHGAHCKTPDNYYNDHGIGICLVGDFTHHPPTPAQMDSLVRLLGFLTEECGIDASGIMTHRGVTHATECPGAQFPLAMLRKRVEHSISAASHGR